MRSGTSATSAAVAIVGGRCQDSLEALRVRHRRLGGASLSDTVQITTVYRNATLSPPMSAPGVVGGSGITLRFQTADLHFPFIRCPTTVVTRTAVAQVETQPSMNGCR
jgi:hypothetical protein